LCGCDYHGKGGKARPPGRERGEKKTCPFDRQARPNWGWVGREKWGFIKIPGKERKGRTLGCKKPTRGRLNSPAVTGKRGNQLKSVGRRGGNSGSLEQHAKRSVPKKGEIGQGGKTLEREKEGPPRNPVEK